MNEALIKKERLGAMERLERQLDELYAKKLTLDRNLSTAQQDMALTMRRKGTSVDRFREMQDALAAATQNANEIHQLERQLKRARETFERDYPNFGRGS